MLSLSLSAREGIERDRWKRNSGEDEKGGGRGKKRVYSAVCPRELTLLIVVPIPAFKSLLRVRASAFHAAVARSSTGSLDILASADCEISDPKER